ncbi:hypothetical protein KC334_g7463 [Hortaea werneckii]|nr:hypothetical protein KC334_g7463 [Hortaea werneckii]
MLLFTSNADFRDVANPSAITMSDPRKVAEHSRTQPPLRLPAEQKPNIKRSPRPMSPQGQPSPIYSLALTPNNLDIYISWDMNDAPPPYDEVVEDASKSENADKPTSDVDDASTSYLSYRLVSRSAPSRRWMNLVLNDESKYRILAPRMTLDQRPEVLLTDLEDKRRVATAQVRRSTSAREVRFRLEASSSLGSDNWDIALVRGFSEWCCEFSHAGRQYSWVRTHKNELGASKLTSRCFKLVHGNYALQKSKRKGKGKAVTEDSTDDSMHQRVLMTYIHSPWFDLHAHEAGEIRIYRDENLTIDKELEHVGLITALGLQQREREARAEALRQMANTSM